MHLRDLPFAAAMFPAKFQSWFVLSLSLSLSAIFFFVSKFMPDAYQSRGKGVASVFRGLPQGFPLCLTLSLFCTAKKKCTVPVHQRSFRPLALLAGGGAKLRLKQAETAMRKREKRQRSERERERRENLCRSVRTPRESASCFFPRSESLSWTSVSLPSPPPPSARFVPPPTQRPTILHTTHTCRAASFLGTPSPRLGPYFSGEWESGKSRCKKPSQK